MLQVNQAVATKYHSSTNNNETTAKRKSVCVEEESLEDALFAAQVSGQGYVWTFFVASLKHSVERVAKSSFEIFWGPFILNRFHN